jgi:hypothetical protein
VKRKELRREDEFRREVDARVDGLMEGTGQRPSGLVGDDVRWLNGVMGVGAYAATHLAVMQDARTRSPQGMIFRLELEAAGRSVATIDTGALVRVGALALLMWSTAPPAGDVPEGYWRLAQAIGVVTGIEGRQKSYYLELAERVGASFQSAAASDMAAMIEPHRLLFGALCKAMGCPELEDDENDQLAMLLTVILTEHVKTLADYFEQTEGKA